MTVFDYPRPDSFDQILQASGTVRASDSASVEGGSSPECTCDSVVKPGASIQMDRRPMGSSHQNFACRGIEQRSHPSPQTCWKLNGRAAHD